MGSLFRWADGESSIRSFWALDMLLLLLLVVVLVLLLVVLELRFNQKAARWAVPRNASRRADDEAEGPVAAAAAVAKAIEEGEIGLVATATTRRRDERMCMRI